jgi:uncharacterized protein (TIGR03663 family)
VSTGSTKSNRKTQPGSGRVAPETPRVAKQAAVPSARESDISERSWLIASLSIMAVGAILRLYNLPLVPFHHDEGVNGNFLVHLVRDGFYHYDPENYHGPTLYYFSAVIPWITRFLFGTAARDTYGLTTFNIRLVTALFGLGTIWLVLLLRRRLGTVGSLAAAALLAVSPGAVYLSRYFIHESLFVFFTLGIVVALVKYYDDGHPIYLVLAAASAGLLFATKETWIISAGVLVIALFSTHVYRWLWRAVGLESRQDRQARMDSPTDWRQNTLERLGGPVNVAVWGAVALGVCVIIGLLFYSSFLTNWKGVSDSLKTFQVWTRTGKEAHVHAWWTYLQWLAEEEAPVLLLGVLGAIAVVLRPKNSLALFCALWAFGLLAAYSMVPYKTPWLTLNFIVPLALISGYAFQVLYEFTGKELSRSIILVAAMALGISLYQTIVLNFFKYDDDHYIYIYAHTRRETLDLLKNIDKIAKQSGGGFDTGITIVSPDYWPLPWYFRDYKRVGYYGRVSASNEPIIIASEGQRAEVQSTFGDRYRQINSKFPLRPGVELLLFVRKDVAAP